MRLVILILLWVGSLLLFSCKKEAYKVDENFVGLWSGPVTPPSILYISISKERGESQYYSDTGDNYEEVDGTARFNTKKNILHIGNKKLPITEYPYLFCDTSCSKYNFEIWLMEVDGHNYERVVYY